MGIGVFYLDNQDDTLHANVYGDVAVSTWPTRRILCIPGFLASCTDRSNSSIISDKLAIKSSGGTSLETCLLMFDYN